MSEISSYPIFLISPLFDARFKLLWFDNFHTVVKMHVIKKVRNVFIRFSCKLSFYMLQNVEADVSNTAKQSSTVVMAKNSELSIKTKCLFPYVNEIKEVFADDRSRILIELNAFLCEDSYEENLLFKTKGIYIHVYIKSA